MLNRVLDAKPALEEGGETGMGVQPGMGGSWGVAPGGFGGSRVQWRLGRAGKAAAVAHQPQQTLVLALWLVLSPVDAL